MNIIQYLISIGYKTFRWSTKGYIVCNDNFNFSTMSEGGLDVRLVKYNSEFVFGLNEIGKPPTLIYPRTSDLRKDNDMNSFLSKNSSEFVFKHLQHLSIK